MSYLSELRVQHLALLIEYQTWAPPCNQYNMRPPHPGLLSDLFDYGLIERDAQWQVVVTPLGQAALKMSVVGMRSVAHKVDA